jgi:classical protein kinase C
MSHLLTCAPVIQAELDQKIQDVYKHIQTERKILEASQLLRQATTNPDVLRRNDAKIRETERSLSYFEVTLRELQTRKMQQQSGQDYSGSAAPQVCLTCLRFPVWQSDAID